MWRNPKLPGICATYDGPSCLRRSVTQVVATSPDFRWSATARHPCDGPSWPLRHDGQKLVFLHQFLKSWSVLQRDSRRFVVDVTARPAGPSQFTESRFSVPNFKILSAMGRHSLDGPSWLRRSVTTSVVPTVFPEMDSVAQNDYTGRYNRYQFTHRSSPND